MKRKLQAALRQLVRSDAIWTILGPFARIGTFLTSVRLPIEQERLRKAVAKSFFKDLLVQNGPFKGMRYASIDSVCSNISPKLLGSYEMELWDTINDLIRNGYRTVLDIGCAEGYYAVGLGMLIPSATVYAYDTDEKARRLCRDMADLNGLSDRVIVRASCTPEELGSFSLAGRTLVICDCEGFEKELFNRENVGNLLDCDLIIEAHDFIDIHTSTYLRELFSTTHDVKSIKSTGDIQKALTYEFDGLRHLDLSEKMKILAEGRPSTMEWLVFTKKK